MKCLYFNEHEKIANQKDCSEVLKEIKNDVNFPNETQKYISIKQLKYLGITNNIAPVATYYIGASWYIKNKYAFIVKPKIDVDYIKMFMTALENNSIQEAEYFSDYYYIEMQVDEPDGERRKENVPEEAIPQKQSQETPEL